MLRCAQNDTKSLLNLYIFLTGMNRIILNILCIPVNFQQRFGMTLQNHLILHRYPKCICETAFS